MQPHVENLGHITTCTKNISKNQFCAMIDLFNIHIGIIFE